MVERFESHNLRWSFVSNLLDAGADIHHRGPGLRSAGSRGEHSELNVIVSVSRPAPDLHDTLKRNGGRHRG